MKTPSLKQTETWTSAIRPELKAFVDRRLSIDDILKLSAIAYRTVHKTGAAKTDVIGFAARSLEHLSGCIVPENVLYKNITRLLANWDIVEAGMQIPDWDGAKTTACLVVIGLARVQAEPYRTPKFVLKLKLKTGIAAGIIQCAIVYDNQIVDFLEHKSGAGKYNCALEEISGMHMRATVSVDQSGLLRLHDIDCTAEQKARNKKLAEMRGDVAKCGDPVPCNVCDKNVTQCPLAIWLPAPRR